MNTLPLVMTALLLVGLHVGSILAYDGLPARIPQHFGPSGAPDRWVETSWITWLLPPIIATAVGAFITFIASVLPRDLRFLNVPNKARLLALPREEQEKVGLAVRGQLQWIVVVVLAMFCGIQLEVYRSARGESTDGLVVVTVAGIIAILVLVIALVIRVQKMASQTPAPE